MREEADRLGDAIASYLSPWVNRLVGYEWPMTTKAAELAAEMGIQLGSTGDVQTTHMLRREISERVRAAHLLSDVDRDKELLALCAFVIKAGGALSTNGPETLERYVKAFTNRRIKDISSIKSLPQLVEETGCDFPFAGIASWSKWLNFIWTDWALIYDARIAFALNAIHFIKGVDARAVPVPVGRNSLISSLDSQSLAAMRYLNRHGKPVPQVDSASDNKILLKWLRRGCVEPDKAYPYYLLAMERAREVLSREKPYSLVDVEMLLFYLSINQVAKDLMVAVNSLMPSDAGENLISKQETI